MTHQITDLKNQVSLLRSAVISVIGKDTEGAYRPEFVQEILTSAQETPTENFSSASSFLNQLKEV